MPTPENITMKGKQLCPEFEQSLPSIFYDHYTTCTSTLYKYQNHILLSSCIWHYPEIKEFLYDIQV